MAAIKVLIVEDSGLVADVLKDALESDKKVRVVGIATNGKEAIAMLPKLQPDLITMDVWMPVMDGFATVEWIMANRPTPILVITSSKLKEDVQISLRMLSAGALDVIEKPSLNDENQWKRHQTDLLARVKLLSSVRVITHIRGKTGPETLKPSAVPPQPVVAKPKPVEIKPVEKEKEKPLFPSLNHKSLLTPTVVQTDSFPAHTYYQAIAIASSTGGPTALLGVLQKLPADFPCGILVVQHIAQGFTQGLVDWLQREIRLKIRIAQDGDAPQPGQVLIAPDRRDMSLRSDFKVVTTKEPDNILCPNADTLFYSMAQVYGRRAIGIVLTGMGSDGAKGLRVMFDAGAYTLAQDEASSLIYGMPRVAVEAGGVRQVLPLDAMSQRLVELLQQPAPSKEQNRNNFRVSGGRNS